LAWPRACLSCKCGLSETGAVVCAACQDEISRMAAEPYCRTCGDDAGPHMLIDGRCGPCRRKLGARVRFSGYVRVGPYAGALRRLVVAFKRSVILEDALSRHLVDALQGAIVSGMPRPDIIVPVPSHWWRRLQRGHQPTAMLAERIAKAAGIPMVKALSVRRYVPPLHFGMNRTDRVTLLNGVFGATRDTDVSGKIVGLLDDVMTTGATLSEARRALKRAGSRAVCAIVLARVSMRAAASYDEKAAYADLRDQFLRTPSPSPPGVDRSVGAA
jgi:ComF family protein